MKNRVLEHYEMNVVPALMKQFGYSSPMQVPKLVKIVLNAGVGETTQNSKAMQYVEYTLSKISGQKPLVTKAKKAIAAYKIRQGLPIGCMVTMRKERMWSFFDRLVSVAVPRMRDFRGLPKKGFDGNGNYNLGIKESLIFPEIDLEALDKVRGFDVTFVTTAKSDDEGRALLVQLGFPFRQ